VIKNLFLGYFSTPQNKRHEVLRMIGGVLLFSAEDFQKVDNPLYDETTVENIFMIVLEN